MFTVTCLLLLIALVGLLTRPSPVSPLETLERVYLVAVPIPMLVAFVLPGVISSLMNSPGDVRPWGVWLSAAGGWLSLALGISGLVLLARRHAWEDAWDRRLLLGLLVAGLPALLIGLVALMYAVISANT
ncbi:MAG TPA: hypothetical protein VH763_08445 [Gemmatimonadales bacterium]